MPSSAIVQIENEDYDKATYEVAVLFFKHSSEKILSFTCRQSMFFSVLTGHSPSSQASYSNAVYALVMTP